MNALLPGDIVLVASDGLVGYFIRRQERRSGEGRTYVNHAAMLVSTTGDLVDAQPPRVTLEPLSRYKGELVAIYRCRSLTLEGRDRLAEMARAYVGRLYGFGKILLHKLGLRRWARVDRWPICSWTVAQPYATLEFDFGVEARAADPDDIFDFCESHPELYECVMPLGILR